MDRTRIVRADHDARWTQEVHHGIALLENPRVRCDCERMPRLARDLLAYAIARTDRYRALHDDHRECSECMRDRARRVDHARQICAPVGVRWCADRDECELAPGDR